jgi:hypothetical protein
MDSNMESNGDNNICSVDNYYKDIEHSHQGVIKSLHFHEGHCTFPDKHIDLFVEPLFHKRERKRAVEESDMFENDMVELKQLIDPVMALDLTKTSHRNWVKQPLKICRRQLSLACFI